MFGKKKTTGTATPVPQVSNKKKIEDYLTSMSFLSHFVIDKKESLVEEEIKTVREIDKVKDSYTDVIEHNASIRETVDSLQKEFGKIGVNFRSIYGCNHRCDQRIRRCHAGYP